MPVISLRSGNPFFLSRPPTSVLLPPKRNIESQVTQVSLRATGKEIEGEIKIGIKKGSNDNVLTKAFI